MKTPIFNMFTKLFSHEYSKTVKTANKFAFPLIWNEKTGRLQFSQKYNSRTKVVAKYIFLDTFYVLGQTAWQKRMSNSLYFNFLLIVSYTMMAICVGSYVCAYQSKEVARNWNGMMLYSSKIYGIFA